MNRIDRQRRAFTLIELLVVVAIIVALLAILMPSLNKAIEVANRAVCASNLHQQGNLLFAYAGENQGAMPPGNATVFYTGSWGIDSSWNAGPKGLGLLKLYDLGYATNPDLYYCPSWRHPLLQKGVINTTTEPGAGFAPGTYGGVPADRDDPYPTQSWGIAYHYRSTFTNTSRESPRITMPGSSALAADHWVRREALYGVDYGHVEGYNTLFLDNSVGFVLITADEMNTLQPGGFYTNDNWAFQEIIWKDWFQRR